MKMLRRVRSASRVLFGRRNPKNIVKAVGGRANTRLFDDSNTLTGFRRIIPRPTSSPGYREYEELSKEVIEKLPAEEARRLMVTNNPAVSRVVNDVKKFALPGWTLEPEGHPLFDVLFDNMRRKNRSFNTLLGEIAFSLAVDGASFTELVIESDGQPKNICCVPAYTAEFRYAQDEDGEYPELGQYDPDYDDYFKPLSFDETVSYEPLYPETGNPYGRNIIDPGLYHLNMVRGFFQSFRQAIASIIWPNLLINVDRNEISDMHPHEQNEFIRQVIVEIKKEVEKLEPGGLLTYGSEVKVGGFISGMNRTNLGAVMDCVDIMDREIIRALETEPVLFGRNEGLAESHVATQMINYGYFIRDVQTIINDVLSSYFNVILRRNNSSEVANFKLHFSLFEEHLKRAEVYMKEKEALKAGSDDLKALVEAVQSAREANLMDEQRAQQYFDQQIEMRDREDLFSKPN